LLFTGGLDGNLDGCECYGYPDAGLVKLGVYLDNRDRHRSVLVDAGDAWEAGSDAALAIELLGAFADLGYDAAVVGDQEFSNGPDFLLASLEMGSVLGSRNLSWEGRSLVDSRSGMVWRNGFSVLVLTLTQAEVFSLHPENFRRSLNLSDPLAILRGHLGAERPDLVLLVYHGTLQASLSLEVAARALLGSVYNVVPPELFMIASHDASVYPSPPEGRRDRVAYLDTPQRKRVEALPSTSRVFIPGRGGNRIGRIVVSRPLLSPPWGGQWTPTVLRSEYRVFNYRSDPDHLGIRSRVLRYNEAFTAATGIERDYEVSPGSALVGSETLALDYFYSPNCVACQNFIHETLPSAAAAAGRSVRLIKRNLMDPREYESLQRILSEREISFQSVPVLVGPGRVLQGESAMIGASLEAFLHTGGAGMPSMSDGASVSDRENNGFRPSVAAVVTAGLLDGVNPCAFSTVIFLVSTLSLLKMRRHRLAAVGISFCAGVFVAYYAVGLGAALILRQSGGFPILSRILRLTMSGFLIVAAGLSLYDALLATRGKGSSMVLQLPHSIKLKIHGLVRSHRADGAAAAGAFILGATVSVLELGCTGQIYLPTLVYLARSRGGLEDYLWLALYNGAFILPLLAVFVLALGGCGSQRVGAFFAARLGVVKGATAVLFVLLAVFLVVQ
jgi:cytochrome c biogenesis protein CcdA